MKLSDRGKEAVIGRYQTGAGCEAGEALARDGGIGDGRQALRARHIACQKSAEGVGGERFPRVDGIGDRRQALVGGDELETTAAVVEPDPQADILMLQGARGKFRHVGEHGIAKLNRIEPLAHRQRHRRGRR